VRKDFRLTNGSRFYPIFNINYLVRTAGVEIRRKAFKVKIENKACNCYAFLKVQYREIFLPLIFFQQFTPSGPLIQNLTYFQFGLEFTELVEFEVDLPLCSTAGNHHQSSLDFTAERFLKIANISSNS
jgi:hypothetical protein